MMKGKSLVLKLMSVTKKNLDVNIESADEGVGPKLCLDRDPGILKLSQLFIMTALLIYTKPDKSCQNVLFLDSCQPLRSSRVDP